MKKFKLFKLLALFVVLITSINAWGQTYKPARVDERKAMPVVTMQGAGMQSQQMMSGGAYSGTVYEPFSTTTPSESNVVGSTTAKAPGGPRKDQASGRNPGEVDPNAASNQSPIGEPWIMLLMALLFGGIIAIKKYKQSTKMETNMKITTMKSFNKTLLTLFVLLIFGVGDAWAANASSARIYFDNTNSNWANYVQLLGGYECNDNCSHSSGTGLGKIANTNNLWTCEWSWSGYAYFYFVNASGSWGDNGEGPWSRKGSYAHTSTINTEVGSDTYLFVPNSGNNSGFSIAAKQTNGYSDLNYTQTLEQKLYNGSSYESSTATLASTIQVSSYYLSNEYTATSTGNQAITSGNSSTTCDAARTATVTYYVSGVQSGYEFIGWYEGDTQKQTAATYTYNATGANTVTARFAPTYTVNIPAGVHGTVAVTGGSTGNNTIGQNPVTITASSPIAGCYFAGWVVTGGAHVASTTDATTTVTATGDGSVTANFAPRFAVIGSENKDGDPYEGTGMPGWGDYSKTLEYYGDNDYHRTLILKGNTEYKFRIREIPNADNGGFENASYIAYNTNSWLNGDNDVFLTVYGSDEITFKAVNIGGNDVELYVSTSDNQTTSHTVNFNSRNFFADGSQTTATTGGTVTAVDWKSYELTTGQKAKSGKAVVFTATPEDGYTFDGWYSNEECTASYAGTSGATIEGTTLTLTIDADKTVYAKFTEVRTEVYLISRGSGHIEVETSTGVWTHQKNLSPANTIYVGKHTTYNIKAVNESGYYFSEWRKSGFTDGFQIDDDSEEAYSESNPEGELKGKGIVAANQLLYAQFLELDKVYFRNWNEEANAPLWSNVYVYFNISWSKDRAISSATANHKQTMNQLGSTNVYWAYVPRDITLSENTNIAFCNADFTTSYTFYECEAADWAKFNRSLDMFVPTHGDTKTSGYDLGSTTYYKGYWKKSYGYKDFLGGYTLKQYGSSSYSYAMPNYNFKIVDENTIQTTFYIKNATKTYDFMIESAGGVQYTTSPTVGDVGKAVYANDCSAITMTEYNSGYPHFTLHPNKEGLYTFTIDQSGERMKISIDYPEAVGDYRIKHTYGAGKTAYSNAVKAAKVAVTDTVSLFLSNEGTPVTVLQKCTTINASTYVTEWSDLNSTNLSDFNSQEPGVYKAGLTITNDAVSNTPVVEAYTGNYYIHVNAKTKNYLTTDGYPRSGNSVGTKFTKFVKNSAFGDTYDYYWVDWFQKVNDSEDTEKVTEAQSVVATIGNDYNIDLAGELGDDAYSVDGKTTTDGANVRYGYDSQSNTFTRAMITGAGSSIKISNSQEAEKVKILTTPPSTYTDCYNSPQSASDADNWMYEFTAQVKPSATASITSSYNSVDMTLANNQKLIEGSGTDAYDLKIIYDFRTNRLITAWIPDPSTSYASEIDLDANMMVVRAADNADDRPTLLNLATGGALNNIKQIYTVMEFTKDHWDDGAWTVTSGGYTDAYFWISLPYDCYISDIFGISDYGSEDGSNWVIQTYRGDLRAEKGWWAETESWWYDMERSDIMKANQGYVIRLTNLDNYGKPFYEYGDISKLQLYFPSANNANLSIGLLGESTTVNYPEIKCTIVRDEENHAGDPNYDRRAIDSNWRIIGSPCFNSAKISTEGWGDTYPTSDITGTLQFFYTWAIDAGKPKYTIQNASAVSNFEFKATHAYFVQYAGDITWVPYSTTPFVGFKAPARAQEENTDQTLCLVLNKNGEQADVTYIKRMEEGATEGYDLNKDLSKVMNGRMANLYTIAGYYKMGGNCLPDTTSIVPVGVRTAVAGEYTFSMPEGTNGTGVYLIDNVAGTRTNLALGDYTVTLAKGTFDDRFSLELSPIAQTPTDIEQTGADVMDGVRKVMVDGILYIVKDGKVFDARGNRVQ